MKKRIDQRLISIIMLKCGCLNICLCIFRYHSSTKRPKITTLPQLITKRMSDQPRNSYTVTTDHHTISRQIRKFCQYEPRYRDCSELQLFLNSQMLDKNFNATSVVSSSHQGQNQFVAFIVCTEAMHYVYVWVTRAEKDNKVCGANLKGHKKQSLN